MNNARILIRGFTRFSALQHAIGRFYQTQPRLANCLTGFATFSFGDVLAQRLENRTAHPTDRVIDFQRSLQIGFLGLFMNGVCLHYWYGLLDRILGVSMQSNFSVFMKMAADQIIYAPFAIFAFFTYSAVRTAHKIEDIKHGVEIRVTDSFLSTFLADCRVWPLANFINFRWIPRVYRPSFAGVIQLLWQTYMSLITESTTGNHEDPITITNHIFDSHGQILTSDGFHDHQSCKLLATCTEGSDVSTNNDTDTIAQSLSMRSSTVIVDDNNHEIIIPYISTIALNNNGSDASLLTSLTTNQTSTQEITRHEKLIN